mgnify:CR=1 FL=1
MVTKEQKEQIIAEYGRTAGDTGSPEVQIAILTARINDLTDIERYRALIEKLGLRK